MDGRHAPVVAGVHRLQHVQRFGAANLTDEDAVGAHSKTVAQQLADGQLSLAFDVGRTVLQRDDVWVVDLQLGGVFDRDHALVVRDEARDDVQGRRLARTGAAGHQDVHAAEHRGLQELCHGGAEAALASQVLHAEDGILELPDGERGAVDGGRPDDGVDTAAIRQASIDHWIQAIDVTARRRHHAPDRLEELVLVLEMDFCLREHAAPLDEDLVRSVDHDLAHRPVVKQGVERSVSDRGAQDDVREGRLLLSCEDDPVVGQEAIEVAAHCTREGERVARGEADVADQGQAIAKVVGELAQVSPLPYRRLQDVGAAPLGRQGRRDWRPHVHELHLEQRGRCGDGRDHSLAFGEADLDRHAFTVRLLARVDVGGDPFPVAEAKDRFSCSAPVAGVRVQVRIVDRAEDHVLDVATGNPARAVGVRRVVDRKTVRAESLGVRVAFLQSAV